jgi:hypothetical protein
MNIFIAWKHFRWEKKIFAPNVYGLICVQCRFTCSVEIHRILETYDNTNILYKIYTDIIHIP